MASSCALRWQHAYNELGIMDLVTLPNAAEGNVISLAILMVKWDGGIHSSSGTGLKVRVITLEAW